MNQFIHRSIFSTVLASALASALLLSSVTSLAADTAAAAGSKAASALIPVEHFFKASQFEDATLSPDGKNVAMLTADQNDHLTLSVFNIETSKAKLLARYVDADVGEFYWVNNQRIVYSLGDRKVARGEVYSGSGLYAVDIHTGHQRQLISRNFEKQSTRVLSPYHGFYSTLTGKDSNDIYVMEYIPAGGTHPYYTNLLRLDTVTGINKVMDRPAEVDSWVLDNDDLPRVVTTFDNGINITWLKDDKSSKWNKLFEAHKDDDNRITPWVFGPDGKLYVTARQGKDTTSLYAYDLTLNKIAAEPLVSLDGYDFRGNFIHNRSNNRILGVRYLTDAWGTLWFDEGYKQIQKKVDELLPGKINLIYVRNESDADTVMVYSYSDTTPGSYLLFNHKTAQMTMLGESEPWIKPEQMAYRDFVKYKARDGLSIPAYLTLPKGQKKNLPMVVLVHGGPFVRGETWSFDNEAQFLASRGYAVLQPEFRGSTGYGLKHHKLGWKQWGLTMQDDVTDGTKWAIEQGIADPKRICIAGASYGGYATLLGLIREPDLYQCGISWVGVTDLGLLHTLSQSDANDLTEKYYLPQKVADLKKDAAQIKATSAIENADKLKAPLILAYGGSDRRVPVEHGERLKSAMKGANPNLEWIVYPEEGHGWSKLKNNVDFWTRVEKFLNKYTWKPTTPASAPATAK
jgi:dipeptidyl aminopeptidase/acylaminoacyl peptidase